MELRLTQLDCGRAGMAVLRGVTLAVPAGGALLLHGANGAGKTTLLRTLAGLLPPLGGQIGLPPAAMAFAGHADAVKPTLSVAENLAFWAAVHGQGGMDAALAAYGLGPLRDRPAQSLSAGQKRRLGLARLLLTGRPVWLLDEPTVALDTHGVAQFAAAVRAHLAAGGLALIATHQDTGLPDTPRLDLAPFRATAATTAAADTWGAGW